MQKVTEIPRVWERPPGPRAWVGSGGLHMPMRGELSQRMGGWKEGCSELLLSPSLQDRVWLCEKWGIWGRFSDRLRTESIQATS